MPIKTVLLQTGVRTCGCVYDALIPLPANADAFLEEIGITDFEDADDDWDKGFVRLLDVLVAGRPYRVSRICHRTRKTCVEKDLTTANIQHRLAMDDHADYVFSLGSQSILLTRGMDILWTRGFTEEGLLSVPFPIERIQNDRLHTLFWFDEGPPSP